MNSFRKRHPQLTLRTANSLSYACAVAHDPEVFQNYFDLLENTLIENKLNHCVYSTVMKVDSPWNISLGS